MDLNLLTIDAARFAIAERKTSAAALWLYAKLKPTIRRLAHTCSFERTRSLRPRTSGA
jgi:hypothetical protein